MTPNTLTEKIAETYQQEALFRLAGDPENCAWWILERVKLRARLYAELMGNV